MKSEHHAIVTSNTLEYQGNDGQWRIEPLNFKSRAKTSDALLEQLFGADRYLWFLDKQIGEKVWTFLTKKPSKDFDVMLPKNADSEETRGYLTVRRKHQVLQMIIQSFDRTERWGFAGEDDGMSWARFEPSVTVQAIEKFQATLGITVQSTPAMTGYFLLKYVHGRMRTTGVLEPPSSVAPFEALKEGQTNNYALIWVRALTAQEKGMKYLHSFDKNHSYMAAASSLSLGVGNWEYAGENVERRFTKDTPGIWRVTVKSKGNLSPLLPNPLKDGVTWYYTPTIALLKEQGAQVEFHEGYLFPQHHRAFENWSKQVLEAKRLAQSGMSDVDKCFLMMVKALYTRAIGNLGAEHTKGAAHRPDWRNEIISNAAQRMYRNAEKVWKTTGQASVACYDDCLYYTSDSPDPRSIAPFVEDKNLSGAYKVKDSYLIDSDIVRDLFNQTPAIFSRDIKLFSLDVAEREDARKIALSSAKEQDAINPDRTARIAESFRLFGEERREAA